MSIFAKGTRVFTPLGPGAVIYARMVPYVSVAESYSVCLDHKKATPSYHGTIFHAEEVSDEEDD